MAARGRRRADPAITAALSRGATVKEAAKTAKVSERTIYRRLQEPEFLVQLQAGRDELVRRAVGDLIEAASDAVTTLRALLNEGTAPVRLGAARAILDQTLRMRDASELAERVRCLEEGLNPDAKERRNGKP